jgi:DNA-binding NarL/FixJ family response regulator
VCADEDQRRLGPVTRILIADHHTLVREGLKRVLTRGIPGARFADASTGAQALRLARTGRFDVVVLDVSLPDRDGLDVLRELQRTLPRLPVLILSTHAEEQFAVRALREGARGYVQKQTAAKNIVLAVRRVASGAIHISRSLAERLASAAQVDAPPHERLSERELEVFRLFARGKTLTAIARQLSLSVQTVSTYRARISDKTGLRSREEMIRYAIRNQLMD